MRDDIPAALSLIAFAAALDIGPRLTSPPFAAAGLALVTLLLLWRGRGRSALLAGIVTLGLVIAAREDSLRSRERLALASLPPERFVVLEVPIERDWSARPHVNVLRSSRFHARGTEIRASVAVYARFDPPPIRMEKLVRVEGHLRPDRRGGYTMSIKSPRLMRYDGQLSLWSPAAWNRLIANRLRDHAASRPDEIAMIEALLLGRGERLSEQTKEDFKRGGTYHLLVFSGLQISLAAGVIALLLRWSGAARAADWSLLGFAAIAPAFIGHEASVSRASTAIALYAVSRIVRRPTTFENLWCVAAIVRLILVPGDLYEPAFHLTYAGAGALLFIGRPLARSRLRWFAYAIAAEIAIAPITLFHFHQYALGGSLTTILMTPIVFAMLVAGALFSAVEVALLLDLVRFLNAVCTAMNRLASPTFGFYAAPAATSMIAGFGSAVAALALLRGRARTTVVMVALLLVPLHAVASFHHRAAVAAPRFTALDVGQGEALLIRSGRRAVLVDGGGRHEYVRFGESVLLPLLLDRGVRRLDAVVLTHAHPDHCGGLAAAIRHLEVRELWISPRRFRGECAQILLESVQETATPIRLLRGGETIDLGDAAIRAVILRRPFRRAPENNNSVILHARLGRRHFLLTGDIERDAERELAALAPATDVLKVAHHGSRTSTSPGFLDAVQPRLAIISCGRNNFFGHPHPDVVEALRDRHVRILRTDRNGTIDVSVIGSVIRVTPEIDTLH
ncbi:MAG TPA: DNA internalization-related competence protein ComEC/Rec2 [Thermoanaerobaculia bacterium]|nr:DNA internalization-related competence protein ComEC/Rec2 [Thermoanaerobaculia bacterium]